MKKQQLVSQDDLEKNFSFKAFERVMTEMDGASTSIGGILSAMVYSIENDGNGSGIRPKASAGGIRGTQMSVQEDHSSIRGVSLNEVPSNLKSLEMISEQGGPEQKTKLANQLDDMFNALAVEHCVVTTDYSHQFDENKVKSGMQGSPYQGLFNESDGIGINDGKFTFMDGQSTAATEQKTLRKMDLPGINERFKMPEKATRTQAERESDTQAIL